MFKRKSKDCSTFPTRWQQFSEEFKKTNDEYDKLPYAAKTDAMIPISEKGIAEKDKAKALSKKLFDLSLKAKELSEESKECYNSKSTFTP